MGAKSTTRSWESRIAALAERQHGVVSRRQLQGLGMGRRAIAGRVERGYLHPVHRGVYAVGHRLLGREARWIAAVLAAGPGAVLSHRSAARLWKLLPSEAAEIELTHPGGTRIRRDGLDVHRSTLRSDEVETVNRTPVTSVMRTVFDLAAVAEERQVERAFNEVEVRGLTDRVSLPMLLERYPGRRGVATLRRVLASREPVGVTESELEERFLAFLEAWGFPRPRLNGTLAVRGRLLRPDCMWEEERLIIELDGRRVHGGDSAFEADRRRDRELLVEGWRSSRITWRQLRDEPDAIAADLRRLLAVSA